MDDQRKDHIDPERILKGTAPNNSRPITCLPMMLQILTAQIKEDIYNSLIERMPQADQRHRGATVHPQ